MANDADADANCDSNKVTRIVHLGTFGCETEFELRQSARPPSTFLMDELIAQLTELRHRLRTNSNKLTLNNISHIKGELDSITSELQNIHNSRLAVNRLVPCVLYEIFAFAVYDSSSLLGPEITTLRISHVCRRWREFTLGWPVLWGFINPERHRNIVELFLNRSKNAPLTLSWNVQDSAQSPLTLMLEFLKSRARLILPRLYSLTLRFPCSRLKAIQEMFDNSTMARSLRYLDLHVDGYRSELDDSSPFSLNDFLQIDVSSLRRLALSYITWSWFERPHHNLTSIIYKYQRQSPPLSTLLTFLSNCPCLKELEYCTGNAGVLDSVTTTNALVDRLDLPYLERLVLNSYSPSGYDYIRGIFDPHWSFKTTISTSTGLRILFASILRHSGVCSVRNILSFFTSFLSIPGVRFRVGNLLLHHVCTHRKGCLS